MFRISESVVRVEYEDCDIAGHLYHPNYLNYCERARSSTIADRGLPFKFWLKNGIALAIIRIECQFLAPAFLYDQIHIYTSWDPPRIEGKSMKVKQFFFKQKIEDYQNIDLSCLDSRLAQFELILVCIDKKDGKSIPFPDEVKKYL